MKAVAVFLVILLTLTCPPVLAQSTSRAGMSGEQLYRAACAACHGSDGRGQPVAVRGFDLELPDFTDCRIATPEADLDWHSVIALGGPGRAFDRLMPAFGEELSDAEIAAVIRHVRTFCADRGWPRGDLNLPRPFVTEKAFPENEAVLTLTVDRGGQEAVRHDFLYEHRVGKRGQYEVLVPVAFRSGPDGRRSLGFGDVGAAYKHVLIDSLSSGSIVSGGGEIKLPTGSRARGFGAGATVFEAFGTFSQSLPRDVFVHLHAGLEIPSNDRLVQKEVFWRAAAGKSYMQRRWGRSWSPMIEALAARALRGGAAEWDLLPQVQVSLSKRQHVLLNAGVRVPVTERDVRRGSALVYLLWDWFDGGLFSGWR